MNAHDFIVSFGKKKFLPIDLDEHVLPALIEAGITDEIYPFYDSKLPEGSLSGYFLHEGDIPDGNGGYYRMATISYGPGSNEMQRLVACKEVLHLFDPEHCQVKTPDDVKNLIEKIILPPELADATTEGDKVFTDRLAILQAVAVLFPISARNVLLSAYKTKDETKKLNIDQIAELAELPRNIVAMVMSDSWPSTLASVLNVIAHIHSNGG
jgi:hypothetical protein